MTVSERLVKSELEIFDQYTNHPFVRGIGTGKLDKEKFCYYLIQDYLYLMDYARVFAIGAAKAKNLRTMNVFSNYVSQITSGEMDIHRAYMERMGISLEEATETRVALENISYTSYMIRIAYEEDEAEIAAAILSCAISYEIIARNLLLGLPGSKDHPFYGEWIRGYTSDAYHQENLELMDLLDELTVNYSEDQITHLMEIFHMCTRYEGAFWDMAWNYEKGRL